MLNLNNHLTLNKATIHSPNLTEKFDQPDLDAIGNYVWEGFNRDKFSRALWEKRTQAAMDLAMQMQKDKNFPWPGCSNVAFPLVTIATLQFHSRAYPAIIQGSDLVRYRVNGPDPQGKEKARAQRIGQHMSYQLLEENPAWEEQHDRLLINVPVVGSAFKKSRYVSAKAYPTSELVMAQDFVLDYYAKSVEDCARKTHVIPMYRNEIYEGVMTGVYRDVREEGWYTVMARPRTDQNTYKADIRHGQMPPQADQETPYTFLEQHVRLDLDGDGYGEPYIITIEETSRQVIRIVTGFDREEDIQRNSKKEVIRIKSMEYFTKYGFIPSPDGGIYDMGFGVLLGPLNESVNSILNQLIDAGTMANTAGGFLGRGAKIRGGVYTFAPLEWKRVDSTADDLKKAIFPLPVREPSQVLFSLLSLLIDYTNRVSGTTEVMVGESTGQNTPASTTQSMIEQGSKIYAAIFKRVWRSMKEEFRKLYILNGIYLPEVTMFGDHGAQILREDYLGDPTRVSPVADPNITSQTQRMQQAMALKQAAMSTPGYNLQEVEKNYLQALHIDSWEMYYPGPDKVPPLPNAKMQIEQIRNQVKQAAIQVKQASLQMQQQQFVAELMEQRRVNSAKILQLEAQAAKLIEEAGGVKTGHQIAAFSAAIGAMKAHDDSMRGRVELMLKSMEQQNEQGGQAPDGAGMAGMGGAPGDQGGQGMPPAMAGGGEGGMGGGGVF